MTSRATLMAKLVEVEVRLTRVESRLVQVMNHFGIKPRGALPEAKPKVPPKKES